MRVPRWALDELALTGRVVRLADVSPPAGPHADPGSANPSRSARRRRPREALVSPLPGVLHLPIFPPVQRIALTCHPADVPSM